MIALGAWCCFIAAPGFFAQASAPAASSSQITCDQPGWFPTRFGLKDHSVFYHNGYYYLISINVPDDSYFAYGRSPDLCTWEDLGPVLTGRTPGDWDEASIWAPFVLEENGVFYLYYTGVTRNFTQSIMLVTFTDPDEPASWNRQGMIFQPSHPNMIWQEDQWANNRDAVVLKAGELYYLYYTGEDLGGPIIGMATSPSPVGPWYDWGATLQLPASSGHAESPMVFIHEGLFYLLYNHIVDGERVRVGASPGGPWSCDFAITPGWAHEVWSGEADTSFTSYLTSYAVSIAPLKWDRFYYPPRPYIGDPPYRLLLPLLQR